MRPGEGASKSSSRFRKLYPLQILLCFLISHSNMAAKRQQSPLKRRDPNN